MASIRTTNLATVAAAGILFVIAAGCATVPADAASGGKAIRLEGYLEYRKGEYLIVDGQRVRPDAGVKFKGSGAAKNAATIPLGYNVKVKGPRLPDGTVVAQELEAKPNVLEGAEPQILAGTGMAESTWVAAGAIVEQGQDGKTKSMGKLHTSGPDVDRARRIVDRLLPAYVDRSEVRVYVVENPEWNAMAMANYSIYVFSGIMADLDDDELAVVLGHEIAHATYEHSRRQASKNQTSGILGQIAATAAGQLKSDVARSIASTATQLGYSAFNSNYSRDYEDQADRVGLRYLYEAGYDYHKAPSLWTKFSEKYGDQDGLTNFFYGDHSTSSARAKNLRLEIQNNYVNPKIDPPTIATGGTKPAPATTPKTSAK